MGRRRMLCKEADSAQRNMAADAAALRRECAPVSVFCHIKKRRLGFGGGP